MTMTYVSLKAQIANYIERNDADTLAEIPNFIYQAEQRVSIELINIGLEVYVYGAFVATEPTMPKPARWRSSLTFNYGVGSTNNTVTQLTQRSYEWLRNYWPDSTQTGAPLYYADYGYDNFLIAPTPDQAYPFELGYLQLPEPLSDSNQTNWLTNNAPQLILYASLLEAIPFLKNDERIPVWTQYYDRSLAALNHQDQKRQIDRASKRDAD